MTDGDLSGPRSAVAGVGAAGVRTWHQFARFCAVGASGYVVNLTVFVACLAGLGLAHRAAASCAFAVALGGNYVCNRRWTFADRRGGVIAQGSRYLVVTLVALAGNLALLDFFVGVGVEELPAQAAAIAAVAPIGFAGNKLWSFR